MLTPVAMVTVHTECLDSVAPGIDATAFSTIMAPHVLLPVAAVPLPCNALQYTPVLGAVAPDATGMGVVEPVGVNVPAAGATAPACTVTHAAPLPNTLPLANDEPLVYPLLPSADPLPNALPLANDEPLPYPLPYAELSPPGGPLN